MFHCRGELAAQQFVEGLAWEGLANREPALVAVFGHIYKLPLREEVVGVYLVAVSAPIASSYRWVRAFGIALAIGLGTSLAHLADDFVSLWCFAAAIASGAIWLHLRETAGARSAFGTLHAPDLAP